MCIGHGIHVAARDFVTFVKRRLKCLLLLLLLLLLLSLAVCEIFSVKEWCDLENRVRVVQGTWKWHHLIDHIRVPISVP